MKTIKSTKGQPLMKVQIPEIFQLQYDQAGKEAVKKVMQDYKGTRVALDTFNINSKGPVKGSNIYSRFALLNAYREITKENLRPINPRESEIALANNSLNEATSYEDLGIIVYPNKGSNEKLWIYLREQLKDRVDLDKPFVITGLMDVLRDNNYENGLRLDVNELTEAYNVLILNEKTGRFDSNDPELQKTGFPSKLKGGDRILFISDNGVRRFYRNRNLNLNARNDDLANSSDDGRVNVVKNFSSENLEQIVEYQNKLKQDKAQKLESLKQKYESLVKQIQNINL